VDSSSFAKACQQIILEATDETTKQIKFNEIIRISPDDDENNQRELNKKQKEIAG
jgi:hypothetical protein